MRIFISTPD